VLAQLEFKNKPKLTTKLALAGGVGLLGAATIFGIEGYLRRVVIEEACDDVPRFDETNCILNLQKFGKQRRNFIVAAEFSLLSALVSGTYWWYKKRKEGPSTIQLSTQRQ
jgi:hypothetical protein